MLNIADHTDSARDTTRPRSRRALLAAVKNPDNWHPADCRPQLRRAIAADRDLPAHIKTWAYWLVDEWLTPAGDLKLRGGVAALVKISADSGRSQRRTTFGYLARLERAGLIERETTAQHVGGAWRRETRLRAGPAFRPSPPATPVTCDSATARTIARTPSMVDVVDQPSRRNAHTRETTSEQITDQDRRAVDDGWLKCARARSDLPSARYDIELDDDSIAWLNETNPGLVAIMLRNGARR